VTGSYNSWLVLLSIAVASFASYVALDLASHVAAARGTRSSRAWLWGGALSMGTGIWSMHFIGMLAFQLPIPMSYDIPITSLSLVIAVVVSGFALSTISHGTMSLRRLLGAGSLMGIGIASMHYSGMAAMQMEPPVRYGAPLFAASIAIAIAASLVALWIAFQLRTETIRSAVWKRSGSALIMGVGITGMHYTGMAAAIFAPDAVCTVSPQDINNVWLAGAIGGFTVMLLATTLLVSLFDARSMALNALGASEERFRSLTELSSDWYWEQDTNLRFVATDGLTDARGGITPAAHIGKRRWELPNTEIVNQSWEQHKTVLEARQPFHNLVLRRIATDGEARFVSVAGRPVFDARGKYCGYRGVAIDITARVRAEEALQRANEQLAQLALQDPLTGLANRRKFAERFEYDMARAMRAGTPLSLLMVDIDHFKEVNDRYGHLAGDDCLKGLAALLTGSVRAVDLVARFGGEEFVVLLPEMSADQSLAAAERMRAQVQANPVGAVGGSAPFAITVSVGAATTTGAEITLGDLLARADQAVYRAKRAGRNRVCT
jgi:diguanylate cyclase